MDVSGYSLGMSQRRVGAHAADPSDRAMSSAAARTTVGARRIMATRLARPVLLSRHARFAGRLVAERRLAPDGAPGNRLRIRVLDGRPHLGLPPRHPRRL